MTSHKKNNSNASIIPLMAVSAGAVVGTYFGLLSWKLRGWGLSTSQMLLWTGIALLAVVTAERMNRKCAVIELVDELVIMEV